MFLRNKMFYFCFECDFFSSFAPELEGGGGERKLEPIWEIVLRSRCGRDVKRRRLWFFYF